MHLIALDHQEELPKEEGLKYQKYTVNSMNKKVKKLRVKLVKSRFGRIKKHKASIAGIGLRKINQVVEIEATPENLGMVNKINYLVEVEEI
ncbi:MAG: 50S ribosomal protein L30 [Gammaproteobacteria bacterium]|jgi:large subunit ribosomal protein L30|nr:50S ribosomal protein L30 [Gammaproteobacteria bacterium]MBT5216372.1 50S ribosomal protein L30 [Gammaproteobacteria bacterium]MBT6073997.1 50S ribosomal protein L30 [Gammaproteobacteria bacterium]